MLHTIILGPYQMAQGRLLRELDDGRLEIDAGGKVFRGMPVSGGISRPAPPSDGCQAGR